MTTKQTIYEGINRAVLSFVPPSADRILDIGCGTGTFGERLRMGRERYVAGITYSSVEAGMAEKRLSQVYCADITDFDFTRLGKFDCVVLSHVLEHMYSPSDLLERLKAVLQTDSVIVVALPNVVWWRQRLQFLVGRWRYQEWGILDRTHFRFFDKHSSIRLLEDAGYEILRSKNDGPFPFLKPIRHLIGGWAAKIDDCTSELMPGLLAAQFVYIARVKEPGVTS